MIARARVVALVAFLLAATAAASLIWRVEQYRVHEARMRATYVASDHAHALQLNIERALSAAYALGALVRQGNGEVGDFNAIARQMLPLYPGVAALGLAPQGVVKSIVPLAGNEGAIGHDMLNDLARGKEAVLARDSGKLTLAGPYDLVQGRQGAVGRLPVSLDNGKDSPYFWGFTTVLIDFPGALEAARLDDIVEQGYAYELWRIEADTGKILSIAASSSTALIEPIVRTLQVPNATWRLSVAPVRGWGDPIGLSLKAALGLLFSLLLAYLARLLFQVRVHEQELERRVAERTRELNSANSSLRESEERFRALTEMSSDFYWETDAEHRPAKRSPGNPVQTSSSARPAQTGKRCWEVTYPSPDEADWQTHRALLDAHEPFREFEFSRHGADGTERYFSISGDPVFDASGAFTGYRGVGKDITGRRQAEQALRAAEQQFRGLIEQSIAGIYIIQDDKLAYVNQRYANIFGYDSAEELIGRHRLCVVPERDRATVTERILQLSEGKLSFDYEFSAVRKDGSTIEIGAHASRATHLGRPAIIGLMQDISEKKRAEQQIQRHIAQLQSAFMSTVEVATTLSEMRDPYTAGHERRVAQIAVAIGAELGFNEQRIEGLRVAGYLHDIGKIIIPAEILSKPGKLSPIEYQMIKGHPQASYDVLKAVEFPWPVADVALQHHERIDGSGYPQGLRGEAIVFEARIMAVADVVEAMSSHRPYRPGLGIDKALAEIECGRGTAYDADAVDACLHLFRKKGYQLPE